MEKKSSAGRNQNGSRPSDANHSQNGKKSVSTDSAKKQKKGRKPLRPSASAASQSSRPQNGRSPKAAGAAKQNESTSVRLKAGKHRPSGRGRTRPQEAIEEQKRFLQKDEGTQGDYLTGKPAEQNKKPPSRYARKLKKVLLAFITIIVLVGISAALSFTVFFKIDEIEVEGHTRYSETDIIRASQIQTGDNLLLYNTSPAADNIKEAFSYIETVEINKQLFNKIIIHVTEATPTSIVESDGKYIVLSKSGKIVEIANKKNYNVPTVMGAKLKNVKLCAQVQYKDKNLKKYLDKILAAIADNQLKDEIITVDISNTSEITLVKKNGFKVVIGNFENVDYKIKTAAYIMKHNVKADAQGRLDVSLASAEGGKSYLKLGKETDESSSESSSLSPSTSQTSTAPEQPVQTEPEYTPDDGGYDEGSYDEGGYDDGGYDDGGYDDGGYDDGGYDDGGYDDGGYDDGGYDDGGYDEGGYDEGGYDDTYGSDEGGWE